MPCALFPPSPPPPQAGETRADDAMEKQKPFTLFVPPRLSSSQVSAVKPQTAGGDSSYFKVSLHVQPPRGRVARRGGGDQGSIPRTQILRVVLVLRAHPQTYVSPQTHRGNAR